MGGARVPHHTKRGTPSLGGKTNGHQQFGARGAEEARRGILERCGSVPLVFFKSLSDECRVLWLGLRRTDI